MNRRSVHTYDTSTIRARFVLISRDRSIIREEVEASVTDLSPRRELPHFLTRQEAKKLLRINETKMSELMGRKDFPVSREFGVKIYTDKLFDWIEENMGNK